MLDDDPSFFDNFTMAPLDFKMADLLELNWPASQLSPFDITNRGRSLSHESYAELRLYSSSHDDANQLPLLDPFRSSSAQKASGLGRLFEEEEPLIFDDNLEFGFDINGEMQDVIVPDVAQRPITDSATCQRVRKEHQGGRIDPMDLDLGEDFALRFDDDAILPDAPAFPPRKRTASSSDQSEIARSESAKAPLKRRKTRKARLAISLPVDDETQISTDAFREQQGTYLERMTEEIDAKELKGAAARAKLSAFNSLFGTGINGVGIGEGDRGIRSELASLFSGDAFRLSVTGSLPASRRRRGLPDAKMASVEPMDVDATYGAESGRNSTPVALYDEEFQHQFDDVTEVGRQGDNALSEQRSSIMPWNISASLKSSAAGHQHLPQSGRQSRLTTASPLVGRGRLDPAVINYTDDFDRMDFDPGPLSDAVVRSELPHKSSSQILAAEDFEYFGVAAAVDTQTAGTSQWMNEAMAQESKNFLDYVKNTIDEQNDDVLLSENIGAVESVDFGALIPPATSTPLVAAQAFYHVLTLATNNELKVRQSENYGEIELSIKNL